jgi:hypothetical protein
MQVALPYADLRPASEAATYQQLLKSRRAALRAALAATSQPALATKLALAGTRYSRFAVLGMCPNNGVVTGRGLAGGSERVAGPRAFLASQIV